MSILGFDGRFSADEIKTLAEAGMLDKFLSGEMDQLELAAWLPGKPGNFTGHLPATQKPSTILGSQVTYRQLTTATYPKWQATASPITTQQISNLFRRSYTNLMMQAWSPFYSMATWDGMDATDAGDPPTLPVRESETPIVGYRTWYVRKNAAEPTGSFKEGMEKVWERVYNGGARWTLVSPVQETHWSGPVLRADSKPSMYDPHDGRWTNRDDHCHGVYAHDKPEWGEFSYGCMGRVEMTGRVIVHERGYRAEAVRITALALNPSLLEYPEIVDELGDRYQCEVSFDPRVLEA